MSENVHLKKKLLFLIKTDFISFVKSFGKCCRVICSEKLHDFFWLCSDEELLEVLEMIVTNNVIMDSL